MSAIFLSYRRDDSSGYAGRLFDKLVGAFGRERVFMDIETLEPGLDFVDAIDRAIESCSAVIVVVGPHWTSASDADGRRRLDDPNDFIRLEICAALKRGVRMIPVLVHDARMPRESDVPEPLHPLCRLQAHEVSDNRWEYDVNRLTQVLEPLVSGQTISAKQVPEGETTAQRTAIQENDDPSVSHPSRKRLIGIALMLVIGGLAAGGWWFSQRQVVDDLVDGPGGATETASPLGLAGSSTSEQAPGVVTDQPKPAAVLAVTPEDVRQDAEEPVVAHTKASSAKDETPQQEPDPLPSPVPESSADLSATTPGRGIDVDTDRDQPAAEPEDQSQVRRIEQLLTQAQASLAASRLTRPQGNNAFEQFQRVLELDPDNAAARGGLRAVMARYEALVEAALAADDPGKAERHLQAARTVDPTAGWLHAAQEAIRRQSLSATTEDAVRPAAPLSQGGGDRAACLAVCDQQRLACDASVAEVDEQACLDERMAACATEYEACLSDAGQLLIWDDVAHKSRCIGKEAQCSRAAIRACANDAARVACDDRLEQCRQRCGNGP